MGLVHGAFCVGCCAALMLLLFVGGVMNLVWIAGLSVFVLAEKLMPQGERLRVLIGVLLMIAGAGLIGVVT
jgi:predicted metal-binding membrane protein